MAHHYVPINERVRLTGQAAQNRQVSGEVLAFRWNDSEPDRVEGWLVKPGEGGPGEAVFVPAGNVERWQPTSG